MTLTAYKWTIEAYHQAIAAGCFADQPVELFQGEIIEVSPESPFHHFLNLNGADYLRLLLGQQAIVSEAHPITLVNSEPEPDIAVVRAPIAAYKNRHPSPEDIYWIIEIADSTLNKDLGLKKALYASAGIPEYWVIDVKAKTLNIFQSPLENDYKIAHSYREGVVFALAFPAVAIRVHKLLGLE
jgi:hypothetical protein